MVVGTAGSEMTRRFFLSAPSTRAALTVGGAFGVAVVPVVPAGFCVLLLPPPQADSATLIATTPTASEISLSLVMASLLRAHLPMCRRYARSASSRHPQYRPTCFGESESP